MIYPRIIHQALPPQQQEKQKAANVRLAAHRLSTRPTLTVPAPTDTPKAKRSAKTGSGDCGAEPGSVTSGTAEDSILGRLWPGFQPLARDDRRVSVTIGAPFAPGERTRKLDGERWFQFTSEPVQEFEGPEVPVHDSAPGRAIVGRRPLQQVDLDRFLRRRG